MVEHNGILVRGIPTPIYATSVLFAGLVSHGFATVEVLVKYPVAVDVVATIVISGNV